MSNNKAIRKARKKAMKKANRKAMKTVQGVIEKTRNDPPQATPAEQRVSLASKLLDMLPADERSLVGKSCQTLIASISAEKGGLPSLKELHEALLEKGTPLADNVAARVEDLITAQKDENDDAKPKGLERMKGAWTRHRQRIASVYEEVRNL